MILFSGSERIYDGLSSTLEEENDNLITISQNLTRKVTYMDHDKDLKCVASHIALREGSINHSIHKISVLCKLNQLLCRFGCKKNLKKFF